ncbi:MAG: hypothetical protein H0V35_07530 [Nitrospira sp.]|nr:hypothetical protein [Nitrospira sp.]
MTGRLSYEESLVNDFSREEEGRGLIMPVVRIEAVECAEGRLGRARVIAAMLIKQDR